MQLLTRLWCPYTSNMITVTHREIEPESGYLKLNLDCNNPFSVDLAANGSSFGAKSIGKG